MLKNAKTFEAPEMNLLDTDGILEPNAVQVYMDYFYRFTDDLVENGEPIDHSAKGLIWILIGFALQIFGALPL